MRVRAFAIGALCATSIPALANDLWNQMTDGAHYTSSLPDQVVTDIPANSTWMVSDVTVGGSGWNVSSIETIMAAYSSPDPYLGLTQAMLNVMPNTSGTLPLPSQDPSVGQTVTIAVTHNAYFANYYDVTASGLSLHLNPGEYWIGLTPIGSNATYLDMKSAFTLTNSAGATYSSVLRNPGGGQGDGAQWQTIDAWENHFWNAPLFEEMDIQGSPVPEPGSIIGLSLGLAGLLLLLRR